MNREKDLFAAVNGYFSRRSGPFLILLGFLLLLFVGIADYLTGTELSLSIFYLLPISFISWFVNRRAGVLFSILSSALGLATDFTVESTYSLSMTVYWNYAVHLGFFLIIVSIMSALKKEYERTLKLNMELKRTHAELEQKTEDLARSNVELERFAYIAAHDLKGPLVSAGAYVSRLQHHYKEKFDDNANRSIGYVLNGIARMEALINSLLTYAKTGAKTEDHKLTDCNKALGQAVANLQVAIEESQARVTHEPLPTLFANEIQMVQLFQNLIGNAVKYCRTESPCVHVSAQQREKEWIISVCDNGIGIEPENVNRIFDPFQRSVSSSKYQGTGIGLAICKKIAEAHKGRIWVESEPGKGSTFCFAIPLRDETSLLQP